MVSTEGSISGAKVFGAEEEEKEVTPAVLQGRWASFLSQFALSNQEQLLGEQYISSDYHGYYQNMLNSMMASQKNIFVLDYAHLAEAIHRLGLVDENGQTFNVLRRALIQDPEMAIEALRVAAFAQLKKMHPEYSEGVSEEFRAVVINLENQKEIPSINHEDIGRLVDIEGFVTFVETRQGRDVTVVYECLDGHKNEVEVKEMKHDKPTSCAECGSKKLDRSVREGKKETIQEIRMQQRYDRADPGRINPDIRVLLASKHLVDVLKGGDLAEVVGTVELEYNPSPQKNSLGNFYIKALYATPKRDEYLVQPEILNQDKIRNAIDPEHEDIGYEKMKRSVAEGVLGHEPAKEAILLMMAGCSPRVSVDDESNRTRGDVQLLMVGDPGAGKTTLADYAYRLFPRAIYISGQVTEAGFTAAIEFGEDGTSRLKAGAYLLASGNLGGIVIADEITRTDKAARRVLASIMDNKQVVSIQKGQFHKEIKVKCSSLHMGNPISQQDWDDGKSLVDNTSLEPWLLQRYDLIFVVRDTPDRDEDAAKARHYLRQLSRSIPEEYLEDRGSQRALQARAEIAAAAKARNTYTVEEMRAIAVYMKRFMPKLVEGSEAEELAYDYYTKTRQQYGEMKRLASDAMAGDEDAYNMFQDRRSTIPSRIGLRDLGAVGRLALASARAHFRNIVTVKDVKIAINLINISMVQSGYNPLIGYSEEKQKREYAAEKKRQVAEAENETRKANTAALEHSRQQKAIRKKLETKWRGDLRVFRSAITKFAVSRCVDCNGKGRVNFGEGNGAYESCQSCYGKGYYPEAFTESAIAEIVTAGNRVEQQDYEIIFRYYLDLGKIIPTDVEGFYKYNGDIVDPKAAEQEMELILNTLVNPSGVPTNIPPPPPEESEYERLLREAKERKAAGHAREQVQKREEDSSSKYGDT